MIEQTFPRRVEGSSPFDTWQIQRLFKSSAEKGFYPKLTVFQSTRRTFWRIKQFINSIR